LKLQLFFSLLIFLITFEWGEKKTEKSIKPRKLEKKNNRKNRTVKKNRLKFKKKNKPVRFRFYKPETEKTKPNQTQTGKKTEPNRKNRANRFKPVFFLKKQTEPKPVSLNQFWLFLKKIDLITFFF